MKSTKDKENLGFVAEGDEIGCLLKTNNELIELLKSRVAGERTIVARILGHRGHEFVEDLFAALEKEQKLYPKIEICNSLANFGEYSVTGLVKRLGKIGNNQHRTPSDFFDIKPKCESFLYNHRNRMN